MLRKLSLSVVLLLTTAWLASMSFASTTFTDTTEEAGVGDEGGGTWVAVGDYDNDGDLDIYVSNGFWTRLETNVLYRNNGDGTFSDVTRKAGVEAIGEGYPTAFFDYDNDGFLDIYVVNYKQPDILYHNNGNGVFTDVSKNAGIEGGNPGIGLAVFDYDNDGFLDIYVGNGDEAGGRINNLHHNNGDGTFEDVAKAAKVRFAAGRNAGPVFCDYDNDGDMDLYAPNSPAGGILFRNNGNGTFDDVTANAKISSRMNWAAAWGDYDSDGDFDLCVPGCLGSPNALYRNNGDGTFTEVSKDAGITHRAANSYPGVAFGDYDNDGYLDIYITNTADQRRGPAPGLSNIMYRNNGDGTFMDVTAEVGLERPDNAGGVFLDYDSDGDLDIYMTDYRGANILYRNNGNNNHWLHIKTIGTKSNRNGIGAKVRVVAGGLSMLRMVGVGSCNGQNSLPVEFGLGEHTRADVVEIRWPSGQVDVFKNVPANRMIIVTEGKASYRCAYAVTPRDKQFATWGKVKHTQLLQNYPNPFNPETWIPYRLAQDGSVVISIYNVKGQLVRSLNLGKQSADVYVAKDKAAYWNGKDSLGKRVASGVYFYTLQVERQQNPDGNGAGNSTATRRMVIVK